MASRYVCTHTYIRTFVPHQTSDAAENCDMETRGLLERCAFYNRSCQISQILQKSLRAWPDEDSHVEIQVGGVSLPGDIPPSGTIHQLVYLRTEVHQQS